MHNFVNADQMIKNLQYMKKSGYDAISLDGMIKGLRKDIEPDVVEVVRCRECTWGEGELICTNPKCGKSWYGCPVHPDHFCSYGERKDGAADG